MKDNIHDCKITKSNLKEISQKKNIKYDILLIKLQHEKVNRCF